MIALNKGRCGGNVEGVGIGGSHKGARWDGWYSMEVTEMLEATGRASMDEWQAQCAGSVLHVKVDERHKCVGQESWYVSQASEPEVCVCVCVTKVCDGKSRRT